MSVPMTKADIINRFNTLVRNQLSPSLDNAPNYYGSVPSSAQFAVINHKDLGSRSEPPMTTGDLTLAAADNGVQVANCIFNLLHNFAMSYTRVRQAKWVYITGGVATEGVMALTALKPSFALYFPLPENPPLTGLPVSGQDVDEFLDLLRIKVNAIRNDGNYMHIYGVFTCHNSCHTSCHGSRGRR